MIIVKIMGGLGNQMQQYSLYRALLAHGREAKLDLSWFDGVVQQEMLAPREFELSRFADLPYEEATPAEIRKAAGTSVFGKVARRLGVKDPVFREREMYHPEVFELDDVLLEGYWANTKYYEDILPELRTLFAFPESRNPEIATMNTDTIYEMRSDKVYSVAIHLRRGDYLDAANAELLGGICTEEYYAGAVRFLENIVEVRNAAREAAGKAPQEIRFYVFSDDPAYAREQRFGTGSEPMTVCDWNQGLDTMLDMQLMASADALITANSTFSFWGGRLNPDEDAIRIRPLYHRNNQTPDPAVMHDYWKGWTLIDREGNVV